MVGPSVNGRQRIGNRTVRIVMTVNADIDAAELFADGLGDFTDFVW